MNYKITAPLHNYADIRIGEENKFSLKRNYDRRYKKGDYITLDFGKKTCQGKITNVYEFQLTDNVQITYKLI